MFQRIRQSHVDALNLEIDIEYGELKFVPRRSSEGWRNLKPISVIVAFASDREEDLDQ